MLVGSSEREGASGFRNRLQFLATALREEKEMACREKAFLLAEYDEAVRAYTDSVLELTNHVASIPQVELALLWKVAYHAKEQCDAAQRILQQHIAAHQC